MCLLYILHFTKGLKNQEVPDLSCDFRPEVTGFVLGFVPVLVLENFGLPGFVPVPVLENFGLPGFVPVPGNLLSFVP